MCADTTEENHKRILSDSDTEEVDKTDTTTKRIRPISETPATTTAKKPKTGSHAAAESLDKFAQAFTEARKIRQPPPMTKLEEALNVMGEMVKNGTWSDKDFMSAYSLMLKDERHATFFCSAPEHIRIHWLQQSVIDKD